jgi:hypothetical protein
MFINKLRNAKQRLNVYYLIPIKQQWHTIHVEDLKAHE